MIQNKKLSEINSEMSVISSDVNTNNHIKPYYKLYNEFCEKNPDEQKYINYILYNDNKLKEDILFDKIIDMIHTDNNNSINITIYISPNHLFNYLLYDYVEWSGCIIEFVNLKDKIAVKYTIPKISWTIKDNFKIDLNANLELNKKTSNTNFCFLDNVKYIYKKTTKPPKMLTRKYFKMKNKPSNFIKLKHIISDTEYIYNYLGYTTDDIMLEHIEHYAVQILNILSNLRDIRFCRIDNKPQNFTYKYYKEKQEIIIKDTKILSHYEWCLIDVDVIFNYSYEMYETSKMMFVVKCLIKLNNKYIKNSLLPSFLIYLYKNTQFEEIKKYIFKNNFNKKLLIPDDDENIYHIYERYTPEMLYCCLVFIKHYNIFNEKINIFDTKFNKKFIKIPIIFPDTETANTIRIILNNNVDTALDILLSNKISLVI